MPQTRRMKSRRTDAVGDWGTNRVRIVRHHRTGALCLDWSERDPDGTRRRRRKVLTGATLAEARGEAEKKALQLRLASMKRKSLADYYAEAVLHEGSR